MRAAVLGLVAAGLAGCAPMKPLSQDALAAMDVQAALRACCSAGSDLITPQMVSFAEANSAALPLKIRAIKTRAAYMEAAPEAQLAFLQGAQPMDVIVTRNAARLSGRLGPGFFTHAGVYLGTEAQLRALGIWDHALVKPYQSQIKDGAIFAEATETGVHLSRRSEMLEADIAARLRPKGFGKTCRRNGALDTFSFLGRPFDFSFTLKTDDEALFCTEMVAAALPQLRFPTRKVYGRAVILPDEIVAHALAGELRLDLVMAVEGFEQGWKYVDAEGVAAHILGAQPGL